MSTVSNVRSASYAAPCAWSGGSYTVQPGDSLWSISQRHCGDGNRWGEIYDLNRNQISDPNYIYPGQVLRLPAAPTAQPQPPAQPKPPASRPQPPIARPQPPILRPVPQPQPILYPTPVIQQPVWTQEPATPSGGGFFSDVWQGGKAQMAANVGKVVHPFRSIEDAGAMLLHPILGARLIAAPYVDDFRTGHAGRAVGRVLADALSLGAVYLGGRTLESMGSAGGASVGSSSGPVSGLLAGVGHVITGSFRAVGSLIGGAVHGVGSFFRWLVAPGSAYVGYR